MKKILFFFSALSLVYGSAAQNSGYMNFTTFGILAGTSSDKNPAPLSVVMEHNYRIGNRWAPGIMTGIEQLNENLMPLALNLKFFIPAKKSTFFLAGLGGYSVSLEKPAIEGMKKARGGFLAGLETGWIIPVNPCAAVIVAVGYRYNELNYKLEDWWLGEYGRKISLNRFSCRIGIAIH